jgi:hypothetical protein
VVLLGGAAGTLVAVAGSKPWLAPSTAPPADPLGTLADQGEMPLAAALGLVVLACWGVILVTRGRVRRTVAVLGLLASLGVVATLVTGRIVLPDNWVNPMDLPGHGGGDLGWTGWFWAAVVAGVLSVVATAAAIRLAPAWPEMGGRYDAPGAAAPTTPEPEDATSLDLWKAMDEGRDPTA